MESERINRAKKQIQDEQYLLNYDDDTLRYVQKPIGRALHRGRPKMAEEDKGTSSDRIKCDLCGKEYVRSNRSHHKKTKQHQLYDKINKKLAKLVLDK